jgi:Zn-dependent M28 family amino/carboxypeptidase
MTTKHTKLTTLLLAFSFLLSACLTTTPQPSTPALSMTPTNPPTPTLPATPTILPTPTPREFSGAQAYEDVLYQVSLGARIPESPAHEQTINWIVAELESAKWEAEIQKLQRGQTIKNVIARRGDTGPWIILGAHFDSRFFADQDPDPAKATQPVIGANDGASGVAVLLELARTLPEDLPVRLWLVFFDAEDNGSITGWEWIMGSRAFVQELQGKPDAAVIIDMIGDANLNIPIEQNSDPALVEEIWGVARDLGYESIFLNQPGYSMIDDHTPFLEAGIPAIDIIDFDYPYWHTSQDTADKVSATSLEIIGKTLSTWLATR